MPSLGDSALIFFLALLLFGPKKLPELARQLGKLMGEFRRASNEFRMQMEEELRTSEQEERQKKIAALEAAAPVTSAPATSLADANALTIGTAEVTMTKAEPATIAAAIEDPMDSHPHMIRSDAPLTPEPTPVPIATSGSLNMMPPATGLPVARSNGAAADLGPVLDSIPQEADPRLTTAVGIPAIREEQLHG